MSEKKTLFLLDAMALIYRAHEVLHVDDFDALKDADE